eukprot:tig00000101_g4444.t1
MYSDRDRPAAAPPGLAAHAEDLGGGALHSLPDGLLERILLLACRCPSDPLCSGPLERLCGDMARDGFLCFHDPAVLARLRGVCRRFRRVADDAAACASPPEGLAVRAEELGRLPDRDRERGLGAVRALRLRSGAAASLPGVELALGLCSLTELDTTLPAWPSAPLAALLRLLPARCPALRRLRLASSSSSGGGGGASAGVDGAAACLAALPELAALDLSGSAAAAVAAVSAFACLERLALRLRWAEPAAAAGTCEGPEGGRHARLAASSLARLPRLRALHLECAVDSLRFLAHLAGELRHLTLAASPHARPERPGPGPEPHPFALLGAGLRSLDLTLQGPRRAPSPGPPSPPPAPPPSLQALRLAAGAAEVEELVLALPPAPSGPPSASPPSRTPPPPSSRSAAAQGLAEAAPALEELELRAELDKACPVPEPPPFTPPPLLRRLLVLPAPSCRP